MASAPMFVAHASSLVIPDLVAHWKLDEGTGTTANDSSVTNADGTIINGTWVAGPGPSGNALSLNGTTAYVDLGDIAAWEWGTGQFTACAWIKDGGGINGRVFGQQLGSGAAGWMWILGTASTPYSFQARLTSPPSTTGYTIDSNWNHITTTRDDASFKLYVGKTLIQDLTYGSGLTVTGDSNLRFGAGSTDGTTISAYCSVIAWGLRLYSRALTTTEIDAIVDGVAV